MTTNQGHNDRHHGRRGNRGRSRGGTGLDTLSLRPRISAGDRGPRTDLERLEGELMGRQIPVARPLPPPPPRRELGDIFGDEVTHLLVVEHRYEQPERRGVSPAAGLAILAMTLLAAVVFVVFALSIAGKLNDVPTPWHTQQVQQEQRVR